MPVTSARTASTTALPDMLVEAPAVKIKSTGEECEINDMDGEIHIAIM